MIQQIRKKIADIMSVKQPRKRRFVTNQMPPERIKMEMKELNDAVLMALDRVAGERPTLLRMYEKAWRDSQVITEVDKAEAYLITEPFEVYKGDSETADKKLTNLLDRPWFTDFMCYVMHAELWGLTLIEFELQDASGEFSGVSVFPRKHVLPYRGEVAYNEWDRSGEQYRGRESDYYLIEVGDSDELGKLEPICREIIWKTFARSDWSEYNERFGKPFITYITDTDSEDEKNKALEAGRDFGSNMIAVIGTEEKIEVNQVASKESANNFETLASFCDTQIANMINGQSGTSNNQAWSGSAEVHERVLTEFTKARLKRVQDIVNYKLIPFLVYHGYPLADCKFKFYGLLNKEENTVECKRPNKPNTEGQESEADYNLASGFFDKARTV